MMVVGIAVELDALAVMAGVVYLVVALGAVVVVEACHQPRPLPSCRTCHSWAFLGPLSKILTFLTVTDEEILLRSSV